MKISKDDVRYIAELCRLKFNDTELESYTDDMENIINFADMLGKVNTEGIEPSAHSIPVTNVFREDIVTPPFDRDKILENAPFKEDGCYLVPKIVE